VRWLADVRVRLRPGIADQAGVLSLDAIRRARVAIRSRLSEYDEYGNDASWN